MTVSGVDHYFPVYFIDKAASVNKRLNFLFLSFFFSVAGGKNRGSSFIDEIPLNAKGIIPVLASRKT